MELLVADLRRIVHDQKCFIARGLKLANEKTNVDVETLAACASGLVAVYLIQGARAQMLANAILTGVPILLTYVFVDECPSLEILLFHWGCFGISVLLDAMVEDVSPGYYLLKVLLFACLYLKPMLWANKIIAELKAETQAKRVPNLPAAVSNDNIVKTAVSSTRAEAGASSSPQFGRAMSGSLPAVSPVRKRIWSSMAF
uniref:Uncharacterized protein n=1 Tax=Ditylenchus dipsaci TaxID=166011 RepID=A0A915E763_9BILA